MAGVQPRAARSFAQAVADEDLPRDDRLDAELLLRHAELELMRYEALRRPERDPLYWTGLISNATVFRLVRDDGPLEERLASAAACAAGPESSAQAPVWLDKYWVVRCLGPHSRTGNIGGQIGSLPPFQGGARFASAGGRGLPQRERSSVCSTTRPRI